jgi:hypothetical protein
LALDYAPPRVRGAAAIEDIKEAAKRLRKTLPPLERLDDVALQLRTMPYAMFMEFADAIEAPAPKLWAWANKRTISRQLRAA